MISTELMKKAALFAGGVLFGTAGVKILGSKDAKKAYVQATAAVLRAKDCVMDAVTTVQENAEDVLAEANEINAQRYAEEACAQEDGAEEAEEVKEEPKKEIVKEHKESKKEHKKEFKKEKAEETKEEKAEVKEPEQKKESELAKVNDETVAACVKFVSDVLNAMGMKDAKVTSKIDEEGALSIDVEGSNMGILIGKRGQTLDSLQYLTNRVANKMQEGYVRVKLDTEDYRRRRKETLENLAKNIASKVKRTRRAVSLEPMNPYERRIIHSALQADPAVSTHSEGEEPYRRVVVTLVRR